MTFAGWTLAAIAPWIGAAAAAVSALYLLNVRRRRVEVAFIELWAQVAREREAQRLYRRLRRLLSWLLQLAILALLGLALADPRWAEPRPARTRAIVIDASASMGGPRADDDPTPRSAAAARFALGLALELADDDRLIVIAAGAQPELVWPAGPVDPRVGPALEAIGSEPSAGSLREAIGLAEAALGDDPLGELFVVTDGAVGPSDLSALERCDAEPRCAAYRVPARPTNLGISAFAARRHPKTRDRAEVMIELRNDGDREVQAKLVVDADGIPMLEQVVALPAGGTLRRALSGVEAARPILRASLAPHGNSADDPGLLGSPHDDRAFAVVPPSTPLRVGLLSDGTDLFLEAALLAMDDAIQIVPLALDTRGDAEVWAQLDVAVIDVGDRPLPSPLPAIDAIVFDPHRRPDSGFPIAKGRELSGPRLTEQDLRHPVLAGVVFKDVNLARATSFRLEPGDVALASYLGDPIMVWRERDGRRILALGLDPRQSDLPLRVAFPLLLANAFDELDTSRPGEVAAIPAGRSVAIELDRLGLAGAGGAPLTIRLPTGRQLSRAPSDGALHLRVPEPGWVELSAPDGATARLAVNLDDPRACDPAPRWPGPSIDAYRPTPAPPAPPERPPWIWVALLVGAIVVLEWRWYHRRRTV